MGSLRLVTAVLACFFATGCIWLDAGDVPPPTSSYRAPGDITVSWSFVSGYCAERPEVKSVRVSIAGEILPNDGIFPCSVNNYPGVKLFDFAGGAYRYTLDAFSWSNARLYTASGTVVVDGDARIDADLVPVGAAPSYAYLYWSFPANQDSNNPSCAQAGISFVDVTIDGDTQRYTCESGQNADGALTPFLDPGVHDIVFTAVDADGYPYFSLQSTLSTYAHSPVSSDYTLAWAVGGTAVRAQLYNGATPVSCASAGYPTLAINFADSQGRLLYPGPGDLGPDGRGYNCADTAVYWFLPPGTYRVVMSAVRPGAAYYSAGNAPNVTITAGVFKDASQAVSVPLYRSP